MANTDWFSAAPIGIDAHRWVTRPGCLPVLVAVHTLTSGQRLLDDVVGLIESDPRVQMVFTQAPDAFGQGVPELLRSTGALVLPWDQAMREPFALALAAAYGGLHEVHAPVMVFPHGAGFGKRVPSSTGEAAAGARPVYGLDPQRLLRDGRVVPAAVALSHESQRKLLRRQCPQAAPVGVVVGDPSYDRLIASQPRREAYREVLGVSPRQELIVMTSTWGQQSLFARQWNLVPQLLEELPTGRYRMAALMHPAVWSCHGIRQIKAWVAQDRESGMILQDPEADWRSVIVAADCVIGDHGSVTTYAAAIGRPVLFTDLPLDDLNDRSVQAHLGATAPRLNASAPVVPQLELARAYYTPAIRDAVAASLTSYPGHAAQRIRAEMYRLLEVSEPDHSPRVDPVPAPQPKGRNT